MGNPLNEFFYFMIITKQRFYAEIRLLDYYLEFYKDFHRI
ncbi:hypothetical protein LEP1GSC064_3564 [Leptospira kirschneri serovar Grippotyphosa str. Moskva]|nr:hypothetical protein LEP1GSC044_1765 [Leptospira kirschneri serovar Grippotyphosa str. RM52]EKQ83809.1 hypothetical protein LEP1GSC064_3564 [Leptospira kirschneri serovar Grippotyphosa str. Moskva]EKR08351.1 hypothetical protein LEP1GSC122_3739 [Leptospira kirschneri serovar Valbuzzi str. 200702274]